MSEIWGGLIFSVAYYLNFTIFFPIKETTGRQNDQARNIFHLAKILGLKFQKFSM